MAFPLYCLLFPKKGRQFIVFMKQNQRLAEDKLKEIIDHFTTNPLFNCNIIKIKEQSAKTFTVVTKNPLT
jgi:hypothetical protein